MMAAVLHYLEVMALSVGFMWQWSFIINTPNAQVLSIRTSI